MNQDSLTKDQAKKITTSVQQSLAYLFHLRERMHETDFPPNDPLLQLAEKAYDAMQRLFMALHYLSCDGVGRPAREKEEPKEVDSS